MEKTQSFAHRHPQGGQLTGKAWSNGGGIDITDTRKLNGKRRALHGVVVNRASLGWEVVHNPGENRKVAGCFKTETAQAAWELSLQA